MKSYSTILLIHIVSISHAVCQSELAIFTHIGHGDQRILLDPQDTRYIKEYRLGIAYNKEVIDHDKFSLLIGGGYSLYHYLGEHHFVEKEIDGGSLSSFRTRTLKYHNGIVNLIAKYKLNKSYNISVTTTSEFTGLLIPYLFRNRYIYDKFKYFGTTFYLGLGYRKGKSTWTPQLRILSLKPTDRRIFNSRYSFMSQQYAEQVDKKLNLNNALQFGIQYAYLINSNKSQKRDKGKLICE